MSTNPTPAQIVEIARGLTKAQRESVDGAAEVAVILVQPAMEPWPSIMVRARGFAAFIYCRWSSWAIGFEALKGGLALYVGPFMIGVVHIDRQLGAQVAAHLAQRSEA